MDQDFGPQHAGQPSVFPAFGIDFMDFSNSKNDGQ